MEKPIIKIRINNTGFLADPDTRIFRQITNPDNIVFFEDCRYRNGRWYVLWNRMNNQVYDGLRKLSLPSFVSELLVDFLDNGSLVKRTVLRTVQSMIDAITHILIVAEGNERVNCKNSCYN